VKSLFNVSISSVFICLLLVNFDLTAQEIFANKKNSYKLYLKTRGSKKSDIVKLVIISDLEGDAYQINESVRRIKMLSDLDGIVFAGDLYENEEIRRMPQFPFLRQNVQEMFNNLLPYAKLKCPMFIIAGNHEEQDIYETALIRLHEAGYAHIIDINRAAIDFDGINIVGLGGYHFDQIMPNNGFKISQKDYEDAFNMIKDFQSQNEITLFITHGPPKTESGSLDYVNNIGHVGDFKIAEVLNFNGFKNIYHFHGHLHERGNIRERFNSGISINVSAITSYNRLSKDNMGIIFEINRNGEVVLENL